MGTALLKIRLMPESPKSDLNEIETKAKEVISKLHGKNPIAQREPVAFGLNAIILNFAMDESLAVDTFENSLKKIKEVNSVEVLDFRRAFG